ncbi:MAG TPA: ABC transporter permease [Methanoregulaceae archaeon]|nr:ABC transporter permease [Methanoregulaceae archaeon]
MRENVQKNRRFRGTPRGFHWAVMPILFLVVWEMAAIAINNQFILPRLGSVAVVLATPFSPILGSGSLVDNAIDSLQRVVVGFAVGAALAVPLGVAMGRWSTVDRLVDPLIQVFRPIPPLAWVPLALAWFKIGIASMVFIIALGSFFPVLLNTLDGVRSVKRTWIEAAMTLGATERQVLTKVILPGALPTIWTGMRVGFGIAWMCVVAAEMMPGTNSGLGYLILYAYNFSQVQVIIAGMIVIGLIGLGIDTGLRRFEERKFRWRELER